MKTDVKELNEIIKIWKELGIGKVELDFDCGGDSMGNMNWNFFDTNKKQIEVKTKLHFELENYFDQEVFNNVQFYETSDGHYQGEAGTVTIVLENEYDDEDSEEVFRYDKVATSEFNEEHTINIPLEINDSEYNFLKSNVRVIEGDDEDDVVNFTYKKDVLITDEDEKLLELLKEKILDAVENSDWGSELSDEHDICTQRLSFTIHIDELKKTDKELNLTISGYYTRFEPSNE